MSTDQSSVQSYLSFHLQEEQFAFSVEKVLEILEVPQITKVPHSPPYMRGVINLRGKVLPVIDTRLKFGMPAIAETIHTAILVLQVEMDGEVLVLGAIVDAVSQVLEISHGSILPPPAMGRKYRPELISAMGKINEEFLMILDADRVFSLEDVLDIQNSQTAIEAHTPV